MSTNVKLTLILHHETSLAILVSDTGNEDDAVWVPKSQCKWIAETAGAITISMPEWLAQDKGLI